MWRARSWMSSDQPERPAQQGAPRAPGDAARVQARGTRITQSNTFRTDPPGFSVDYNRKGVENATLSTLLDLRDRPRKLGQSLNARWGIFPPSLQLRRAGDPRAQEQSEALATAADSRRHRNLSRQEDSSSGAAGRVAYFICRRRAQRTCIPTPPHHPCGRQ